MRAPRKSLACIAMVLLTGSLAACAEPPAEQVQRSPSRASTRQLPVAEPISAAGPEQTAARETRDLFRQMIVGINTLSTASNKTSLTE